MSSIHAGRRVRIAGLAVVVSAGCSRPAPTSAPRSPPAGATGWMWTASTSPAWRAPQRIVDVAALDDRRALILGATGALAALDLTTGAVTTAARLPAGAVPTQVLAVDGGPLLYGRVAEASAAWRVDPAALTATPVVLPEPGGVRAGGAFAVAASPDGTQLLTCGADRWPTWRDAATLAVRRVFVGVEACAAPVFVDAGHVTIGRLGQYGVPRRVLDLGGGTTADAPAGGAAIAGPGGLAAVAQGGEVRILAADGAELTRHRAALTAPVWLADGSAVISRARKELVVLPSHAGQAARPVPLDVAVTQLYPVPGSRRLVFTSGGYRLGLFDTTTGAITTAAGNRGPVAAIAPSAGRVVAGADRVRIWDRDRVVATGPRADVNAVDADPGVPVVYATFAGVFRMDPATGATTPLDADAASNVVDRHGRRAAWERDDHVMIVERRHAPEVWLRRGDDYTLDDLDVATGRIALNDAAAYYVAHPDGGRLYGFFPYDCDDPLYLLLARGREWAATFDGVNVHLYDTAAAEPLGGLELVDGSIDAVAFVPGRAEVVVVGAAVYLWDPTAATVRAWPLPPALAAVGATAVGVDAAGEELAIGFGDGAILWAKLAELRARATPVGPDVVTLLPPAAPACDKPIAGGYDELAVPDDDDDDDDDVEGGYDYDDELDQAPDPDQPDD
ncbi:MAG: hypothetical protein R3B06_04090 [Kofleriaceae bacterium]